jgi:hypothetical protein
MMPLTDKVDELFAEWNKPDSPGCALAVIKDGEVIYKRGYGMADLERNVPNTSGLRDYTTLMYLSGMHFENFYYEDELTVLFFRWNNVPQHGRAADWPSASASR